jgi:hypothetical protein
MIAFIKKYKHVLAIATVLAALPMHSQVTEPELDKKYTPNESSIFNTLLKRNESSSSPEITFYNSLRFCPTMLIRQRIGILYERKIFDGLSLGIGAAKIFGNDVFENANLALQGLDEQKVLDPNTMFANSVFSPVRPLLMGSLRLYFGSNAFDGSYIELTYKNQKLDYALNSTINTYKVDSDNVVHMNMNGYTFGYGYSWTGGKKNKITHDFFFNVGIKLVNYTRFELVNVNSFVSMYKRTNEEVTMRILPSVNIGYSFGFGF